MSEHRAYPLSWPENWPRTARGTQARRRFVAAGGRLRSMEEAVQFLSNELRLLGARQEILSTNVKRRLDGVPYSNQSQPDDTGAALYFEFKGKPVAPACDRWRRVEDNGYAIALHIESLRGQQRWGVGSLEQAFRGY